VLLAKHQAELCSTSKRLSTAYVLRALLAPETYATADPASCRITGQRLTEMICPDLSSKIRPASCSSLHPRATGSRAGAGTRCAVGPDRFGIKPCWLQGSHWLSHLWHRGPSRRCWGLHDLAGPRRSGPKSDQSRWPARITWSLAEQWILVVHSRLGLQARQFDRVKWWLPDCWRKSFSTETLKRCGSPPTLNPSFWCRLPPRLAALLQTLMPPMTAAGGPCVS